VRAIGAWLPKFTLGDLEDLMEARAVGRYLRVTPRKARLVLDAVKGKSANQALAILKFIPNEAARYIERLIASAIANAEHNYSLDRDTLRLTGGYVDTGPSLKRIQPRAMGRAYRILRRTSHITVVLSEDEKLRAEATKAKARKPAGRRGRKQTAEATAPKTRRASKQGAEAKSSQTSNKAEE